MKLKKTKESAYEKQLEEEENLKILFKRIKQSCYTCGKPRQKYLIKWKFRKDPGEIKNIWI